MPKIIPAANATDTRIILNTIRQNSNSVYKATVPALPTEYKPHDYLKIGEIILGTPGIANEFISTLVNRVALAILQSMDFNNPWRPLKKGYLEYGEVIEDIFVNISKAHNFQPELSDKIELKNWPNDVRTAFYAKNFSAQYRNRISFDMLKYAFTSYEGVSNLMDYLIRSMYTAMEYDDYLMGKYVLIKGITHGHIKAITGSKYGNITATPSDINAGIIRGYSSLLTYPSTEYNEAGVLNNTPRERQYIIMSSLYEGAFDAEVLAQAFNMSKAEWQGHKIIVDDFGTFDNSRFSPSPLSDDEEGLYLRGFEPVTDDELAIMSTVIAVAIDEKWAQFYDTLIRMTSTPIASGLAWNNFLTHEGIIAHSPFANAIAYMPATNNTAVPDSITAKVMDKRIDEGGTVLTLAVQSDTATVQPHNGAFVYAADGKQEAAYIGIDRVGIVTLPPNTAAQTLYFFVRGASEAYASTTTVSPSTAVGATITFSKAEDPTPGGG